MRRGWVKLYLPLALPKLQIRLVVAHRKPGPSKPRAGLGFKKDRPGEPHVTAPGSSSAGSASKGQDDFRKMLLGKK